MPNYLDGFRILRGFVSKTARKKLLDHIMKCNFYPHSPGRYLALGGWRNKIQVEIDELFTQLARAEGLHKIEPDELLLQRYDAGAKLNQHSDQEPRKAEPLRPSPLEAVYIINLSGTTRFCLSSAINTNTGAARRFPPKTKIKHWIIKPGDVVCMKDNALDEAYHGFPPLKEPKVNIVVRYRRHD